MHGTEFRVAYHDPTSEEERTEQEVNQLPAPDLSAALADLLKPLAHWALLACVTAYRMQVSNTGKFDKILSDIELGSTLASASAAVVSLASVPLVPWVARVRDIDGQVLVGCDSVKCITIRGAVWRVTSRH